MKRAVAFVSLLAAGFGALVGSQAAAAAKRRVPSAPTTTTTNAPTTTTTVPPAYDATTVANVRTDADWLLSAQLTDGAIGHYVDRVKIWPYLGNEAALGLARATQVTGDPKYLAATWRWLQWYQAHQDTNGFVTDYTVV